MIANPAHIRGYLAATALIAACATTSAFGGGQALVKAERYLFDLSELPRGLRLPAHDDRQRVTFSQTMIRARSEGATREEVIEPIRVNVPRDASDRADLVERMAREGREQGLMRYFNRKLAAGGNVASNAASPYVQVVVEPSALGLFDLDAIRRRYARVHHHLTISTADLRERPRLRHALIDQVRPYLTSDELERLLQTLTEESYVDVDEDLLPGFARTAVTKFIKYRGPNCFQTALAFQDPLLPKQPDVNSKRETGYHPAMINNDELLWALTHDFDEVDLKRDRLRYGDMLVYLDVGDLTKPVDYHWIKHAATYLFGDYTFSKGSNSPDTPYTVKTLEEEWSTWAKRTDRLGLKVYRYRR